MAARRENSIMFITVEPGQALPPINHLIWILGEDGEFTQVWVDDYDGVSRRSDGVIVVKARVRKQVE